MKQKESGHLSYACPKNMLGEREPPKKKEKKKKKKVPEPEEEMYVYLAHSAAVLFAFLLPPDQVWILFADLVRK